MNSIETIWDLQYVKIWNCGLFPWFHNNTYWCILVGLCHQFFLSLFFLIIFPFMIVYVWIILKTIHPEYMRHSCELLSTSLAFLEERTPSKPGVCITQGSQGILIQLLWKMVELIYLSRLSISFCLSSSKSLLPFFLSISVSPSLIFYPVFLILSLYFFLVPSKLCLHYQTLFQFEQFISALCHAGLFPLFNRLGIILIVSWIWCFPCFVCCIGSWFSLSQ